MSALDQFKDPYFHLIYLIELDPLVAWSPIIVAAIAVMLVRFGSIWCRRAGDALIELVSLVLSEHGTKTLFNGSRMERRYAQSVNRQARRAARAKARRKS